MNKNTSFILAILMVLATVGGAIATLDGIAILTPNGGGNRFNGATATCRAEVNITGIVGNANATNVSFRASTDSSYSTSLCVDNVLANTTDTASCTCDMTSLTDGKYNFVAVLYNGTNQINSTISSVITDDTAPNRVNVNALQPPKFQRSVWVECDSNDAIQNASIASTRYVINWTRPDGTNFTANGVSSTEFSAESFDSVGTYTLTCDVNDLGNNTARDTKYLTVDTKDTEVTIVGVGGVRTSNATMILVFVGVVVLLGIIGVVVAVSSGGKKRRR